MFCSSVVIVPERETSANWYTMMLDSTTDSSIVVVVLVVVIVVIAIMLGPADRRTGIKHEYA